MRLTPKFSVCLMTIGLTCVGLVLVFCSSVWSKEAEKNNARIKELQQKRLAVLEEIHEAAKNLFRSARVSFDEAHPWQVEFFSARLEAADTREDRIKVYDDAVQEALEWHQIVKSMVEGSRTPRLSELKAQAYLLETQIRREKAETAE